MTRPLNMYVSPSVTIITEMIGSPIRGLSTRRYTANPKITEKTIVSIKEAKKLRPKSRVMERQI